MTQELSHTREYESQQAGILNTRGAARVNAGPQISTCDGGTDTMESTRPIPFHARLTIEQATLLGMALASLLNERPDVVDRHADTYHECYGIIGAACEAHA